LRSLYSARESPHTVSLVFSGRESAKYPLPVAVTPPPFLYESPTGGAFLPHPDILTLMVGDNLDSSLTFSLQYGQENWSVTFFLE
jgi:hypothetical protein